jgi:hypothetical protein
LGKGISSSRYTANNAWGKPMQQRPSRQRLSSNAEGPRNKSVCRQSANRTTIGAQGQRF